jgi:hypothetical protein
LPPLLQEVVPVRSQVSRQADVAEVMGLSRQRVAHLLVKASLRVAQLNEERHDDERPVASPRAARLRELEDNPPEWLKNALNSRPMRSKSDGALILAWRRAALAIDDYRSQHLFTSLTDAIGPTPLDPAARRSHQRAERAIAAVAEERELRKHGSRPHSLTGFGGGRRRSRRRAPAPARSSR